MYQPEVGPAGSVTDPVVAPLHESVTVAFPRPLGACEGSFCRCPKKSCAVTTPATLTFAALTSGDRITAAAMTMWLSSCWMALHPVNRAMAARAVGTRMRWSSVHGTLAHDPPPPLRRKFQP